MVSYGAPTTEQLENEVKGFSREIEKYQCIKSGAVTVSSSAHVGYTVQDIPTRSPGKETGGSTMCVGEVSTSLQINELEAVQMNVPGATCHHAFVLMRPLTFQTHYARS